MAFLEPNCGDAGYKIIWLKRELCGADGVSILTIATDALRPGGVRTHHIADAVG